ncbi:hypothetical protein GQ55_1G079300 [Panicum hallii var. hallii]|uniref:Uncharacterized protein n=1 Tax=Panicum hallii var. hallii TaxID=1504633 RepID=A0A2T7F3G2_9POAL|nr:hypothetical protein GQ55_1G079300 [Panicum hallii var. hallii]
MPNPYLASSKTRYRCFFSPVPAVGGDRLLPADARPLRRRSSGADALRLVPDISVSPPPLHPAPVTAALSLASSGHRSPSLVPETSPREATPGKTGGTSVTRRRRMELMRRPRRRLRNDRHAHIVPCSAPSENLRRRRTNSAR